ncbi:hypothetical protein KSP35_21680 [Aquihabitans sp. G128]|uniref:hypothetical protein n=1 Tax=Aquihabitans sp. G128 TaxID=2849779 RepID=UPI001C216DEB|nr:hypothetical protein [Aquihabitans sp. G128]QXC60897.1 hypothetical protein KSP35_21680 [Aquihabitans sp. G128]
MSTTRTHHGPLHTSDGDLTWTAVTFELGPTEIEHREHPCLDDQPIDDHRFIEVWMRHFGTTPTGL